jgi:putative transposase
VPHRDRVQPRALSPAERAAILNTLHSPRFADPAPAEVWAILLDAGTYLGSQSTFYRLLRAAGEHVDMTVRRSVNDVRACSCSAVT